MIYRETCEEELKRLRVEYERSKENSDILRHENEKLIMRNNEFVESIDRLNKEIIAKRLVSSFKLILVMLELTKTMLL